MAMLLNGMSFPDYAALNRVNPGTAKLALVSPKHYKQALIRHREPTDAMMLGQATHCAILEPVEFGQRYAVYTGRRAGADYQAFVAANVGREILNTTEYSRCTAMRLAVARHPVARRHLDAITGTEVVATWADSETGLECKGRLDAISKADIIDVKTCSDLSDRALTAAVMRYGYHISMAAYQDGLGDDMGLVLIFVESNPPYDVVVYRLDPETVKVGLQRWREALRIIRHCRETDTWPGIEEDIELCMTLPEWAVGNDELALIIEGSEVRL